MKRMLLIFSILGSIRVLSSSQAIDSISLVRTVDSLIKVKYQNIQRGIYLDEMVITFDSMGQIVRQNIGYRNWPYVKCNYWKSRSLLDLGRFREAEIILKETKGLQENYVGTKWIYGQILAQLSFIYEQTDRYFLAEKTKLQCDEYFRTMTRPWWDIAIGNTNSGEIYWHIGQFEKSEYFFLKADSIFISNKDSLSNYYTDNLCKIGDLYFEQSEYGKSRYYLEKAKNIYESSPGGNEKYHMAIVNSLAILYKAIGEYKEAEKLIVQNLKMIEEFYGKENIYFLIGAKNYAMFLATMGRFIKSRDMFLDLKSIMEKLGEQTNSQYAITLLALNDIFRQTNPEMELEETYIKAMEIIVSRLGKESGIYVTSLLYLGDYYIRAKNYPLAESILMEAIESIKNIYGERSLNYSSALALLSKYYLETDQIDFAQKSLATAKSILREKIGLRHAQYSDLICQEAIVYFRCGDYTNALKSIMLYNEIDQNNLEKSVNYLSEQELFAYTHQFKEHLDFTYSYAYMEKNHSGELSSTAYNQALFYKGFILNSVLQWRHLFENYSDTLDIGKDYKIRLRELTENYEDALTRQDTSALLVLGDSINQMNKKILGAFPKDIKLMQSVTWENVVKNLSDNEAAIEFISFNNVLTPKDSLRHYAALLVTNKSGSPVFIPLFDEFELKNILSGTNESATERISKLYGPSNKNEASLYELIWKPLESFIHKNETIYVSKDGLLNLIDINSIPLSQNVVVGDRYNLLNFGSTRELVVSEPPSTFENTSTLFGGIRYEIDTTTYHMNDSTFNEFADYQQQVYDSEPIIRGKDWVYLSGSESEISHISTIMNKANYQYSILRDSLATEEFFKGLGCSKENPLSPRVIHLSTHGYFFPYSYLKSSGLNSPQYTPLFKISDNPMIRSGLILAGGNYAWKHGHPYKPGMEDGILTAYEISQMDLSNTELVVLSACETGLGDIEGNEGVYGLQRAFKIAGVKNLIMSLWQVPDAATAELMTSFYKHWLEDKMTIREALHQAQKEMRDQGMEPYEWAGFILVE